MIFPGLGGGGGKVFPIMAKTGRPRHKGVPFSCFMGTKGLGFHQLRYIKGSLRYLKEPLVKIF